MTLNESLDVLITVTSHLGMARTNPDLTTPLTEGSAHFKVQTGWFWKFIFLDLYLETVICSNNKAFYKVISIYSIKILLSISGQNL